MNLQLNVCCILFLSITALLGFLFGIVTFFFAEPLLLLMGAEPAVIADGAVYFRIVGVPSVFISLMTIFGSILFFFSPIAATWFTDERSVIEWSQPLFE